MVISDSEIDLNNWGKLLDESKLKADFNVFQNKILELNLRIAYLLIIQLVK